MTITVTPSFLISRHVELTGRTDLQTFIDEASEEVNTEAWGTAKGNTGIHYLSMHLITLDARATAAATSGGAAAGGGPVLGTLKWEAVGPLQKGYTDPRSQVRSQNNTDAWYNSTSWGQRYLQLREEVFTDRVL